MPMCLSLYAYMCLCLKYLVEWLGVCEGGGVGVVRVGQGGLRIHSLHTHIEREIIDKEESASMTPTH